MDWAAVEELVYSESRDPHAILCPKETGSGLLIQAFLPGAAHVEAVLSDGVSAEMEEEDENGFFACLIRGHKKAPYRIRALMKDGTEVFSEEPWSFAPELEEEDLKRFAAGNHTSIHEKLGAHVRTVDGVSGVRFAVWAPNALRVSVVGDFNRWDGRVHQMRLLGDSGVFEIFIPGLKAGQIYKYEIKTPDRKVRLKADPYARAAELRPGTASVVADSEEYPWTDAAWLFARGERAAEKTAQPLNIYEVNLFSWMRGSGGEGTFPNYREAAEKLSAYAKEMNYTHVELMPVTEYPLDAGLGYRATGFFAPTARGGSPDDFRAFVDIMHGAGVGVILDWPSARFPKDDFALARFDGTALYEYEGGASDTAVFSFGRPEVLNFLCAAVFFWAESFHVDGFRLVDMSSILYFSDEDGLRRNMYGGGENLDGVNFVRRMTAAMRKAHPDVLLIADGSAEWPMTTKAVKDDGLGFDYRCNTGWSKAFLGYLGNDAAGRSARYGEMTYPMLYQYCEDYILSLSHSDVSEGKASIMHRIPAGSSADRFAAFRAAAGFFMTHPGKKLLFSGQEFGMEREWTFGTGIDWDLLEDPDHRQLQAFMRDLNSFYLTHPALWREDGEPAGFEWINCHSWEENVVVFVRSSGREAEDLLVAVNFSGVSYPKFNTGIPYYGTFREVFSSDRTEYGGSGMLNARPLLAKRLEVDDRTDGITMCLPANSVVIFSCTKRERPAKKAPAEAALETAAAAKNTAARTADAAIGTAVSAKKTAADAGRTAADTAAAAKDAVVKKVSSAKDAAVKRASSAKETAVKTASSAKDAAVKRASSAKETAVKTASSAKDAAVKKASSAKETAVKTASSAKDAAVKKASSAKETAVKTASSAKDAAVKKASSAKNAAVKKASAARQAAKKTLFKED